MDTDCLEDQANPLHFVIFHPTPMLWNTHIIFCNILIMQHTQNFFVNTMLEDKENDVSVFTSSNLHWWCQEDQLTPCAGYLVPARSSRLSEIVSWKAVSASLRNFSCVIMTYFMRSDCHGDINQNTTSKSLQEYHLYVKYFNNDLQSNILAPSQNSQFCGLFIHDIPISWFSWIN